MVKQTYERIRNRDESGFTLIEILATIAILGILIAISVPVYLNHQKSVAETEVKANLLQAAILIDQEKIDNNGLYPKYMPNEILSNPKMKAFAYTYGDNRLIYCLQGTTPAGKSFFVSSFNKQPGTDSCTQKNVASGSVNPGNTVVVPSATVSTASNTWGSRDPAAVATLAVSPVTCTSGTVSYMIRATDTSTGQVITTDWQNDPSTAALTLTGFYPEDNVSYDARARCSITGLNYVGNYGGAKTDVVSKFVVAKTAFTSDSVKYTWTAQAASPSYSASWGAGYCPIGSLNYSLTGTPYSNDTPPVAIARYSVGTGITDTSSTGSLPSNFASYGGNKIDLGVQVNCVVNGSKTYSSDATTYSDVLPVGPPGYPAPATYTMSNKINNNGFGGVATLTWGAVTCKPNSTPTYYLRSNPYGDANIIATSSQTTAQVSNLLYGDYYNVRVTAKCINATGTASVDSSGYINAINVGNPLMALPTVTATSSKEYFNWTAPTGTTVSKYLITWTSTSTATPKGSVSVAGTVLTYNYDTQANARGKGVTITVTAQDASGNTLASTTSGQLTAP